MKIFFGENKSNVRYFDEIHNRRCRLIDDCHEQVNYILIALIGVFF